ncbi:MAG: methyl-accepting chemotaxis protein [Marinobacter sp.]|uniref:methyl-accepting chemotaxis protein n=1 Tax=Marinobacter sp. TaxID=50741 RepID=UPI00299E2028|nr:methyl-accepting chemotaxis protein [Marinobacter sp.]MDX1634599.1 methyl-accepting chemotaxis protein [Marinobacter sp.]
MADTPFQSVERRLGVSGKLLIAPVFILLLFGLVTFYSVREFQNLDQRMETVATELAPETAVATEVLVKLYQLRLQAFDYYQTGNEDILARFQQLESELLAELERARSNLQAPDRVRQVDQIEQATLQYARIFRDELVPAKQQVQRIVAEQLDEYGPAASEALRRAIDGITNRAPDSPLRVALEQLINDTLLMRVATQRYFADGTDDSEAALKYAMEDVSVALEFLDRDAVPDFIRQYLDAAFEALGQYQVAVNELLVQQSAMKRTKNQQLDGLGPEITALARGFEEQVFAALESVAEEAGAETDTALRLTLVAFAVSVVLGLLVSVLMSRAMAGSVKRAREGILGYLRDIGNNRGNVETRLAPGRADEIGDFIAAVNQFLATLQDIIAGIATASGKLNRESESLSAITGRTSTNSEHQREQITQVAAAMQEMGSTSDEIASNTSDTDESARHAAQLAETGQVTVSKAVDSVARLAEQVQEAAQRIQRLEQESGEIGKVLAVIQSIAEQTNLLALNAAIEAARAGDAGRGFSVVADEVRGLAKRVQDSTVDIERIVSSLQQEAAGAVVDMSRARQGAKEASEQAGKSGAALAEILDAVNRIADMTTQVASATEQQRATAAEMTRNVEASSSAIDDLSGDIAQVNQSGQSLAGMAGEMSTLVRRFQVD